MVLFPHEPETSDRMRWAVYGWWHKADFIRTYIITGGLLTLVCSALYDDEGLRRLTELQYVPNEKSGTWANDRSSMIEATNKQLERMKYFLALKMNLYS